MHLARVACELHVDDVADLDIIEWAGAIGCNQNSKRWNTITARDIDSEDAALRGGLKEGPCITAYCDGVEGV